MGGDDGGSLGSAVVKQAVAVGYASLDYPATIDGYFKADHTVMIRKRPTDAFPRPGGSQLYVARCLAKAGVDTSVITWIGRDDLGELFRSCVIDDGIRADGIAVVSPGLTPICFLIYQKDGSCGCCFDPGFTGKETLTSQQSDLIKTADLVCVTVSPPEIGMQALELARDDAMVAWVAKNDPFSYPQKLRAKLGERADYIFCNVHERGWIDAATQDARRSTAPVIVETDGTGDVGVYQGNKKIDVMSVQALEVSDTSGAGDTLAGGCLAAVMNGDIDPRSIAAAGIETAHSLLTARSE